MSTSTERLIAFYDGTGTDHRGRTLADIHAFPHERLEHEHDFIQWLFPLPTPSPVNPAAPVLDDQSIAAFNQRPELRDALRRSFEVMASFYGFEVGGTAARPAITRSARWQAGTPQWLTRGNHNFLRISRILKSLSLLGHRELAVAFLDALEEVYDDHREVIGSVSLGYWRRAIAR